MLKIYITTIPMQGKFDLDECVYEVQNIHGITCNQKTRFPIIPIIHDTAKEGDQVRVLALQMYNEDTQRNRKYLQQELEALGYDSDVITDVTVSENQQKETLAYLYKNLIKNIPDNCEVYACITYGTKTVPIMIINALRYVEKYKENVDVIGLYYGEIKRNNGVIEGSKLFDVSTVYFIDRIIDNATKGNGQSADKMLEMLLPDDI